MALKALFSTLLALFICRAVALDFSNSHWIWYKYATTVPVYAVGDFRYDLKHSGGPHPVSAEIIIAGDNDYTLWVNGNVIGKGTDWTIAQKYCVVLNPLHNVFAAQVVNAPGAPPNPAALLAAVEVFYSDGSTKTIVSDRSWLAHRGPSPGFQSPIYNDHSWTRAVELGTANTLPWHTPSLPGPPPPPTLAKSEWIWTNEISGPGGNAPAGSRAFRKDITIPGILPATGGTIVISTDNQYTLYINGQLIGTHADWTHSQTYPFTLTIPTQHIVVAVAATNFAGPAGVIAALQLNAGCSNFVYVTDSSWKYNLAVPSGFQLASYNDASWPHAVQEGLDGVSPWGTI
ncbi:hypothetical protein F5887DRAFT_1201474 [Amanita rubescens]|nr:hypothetical protein F5887DRAFT_1201474 [Amanita rubescens]